MDLDDTLVVMIKNTSNQLDRFMGMFKNEMERTFKGMRNISVIQGRIIAYIYANGGSTPQKDIEKNFNIRSSTSAVVLRRMENNGLILREADDANMRQNTVKLTRQAMKMLPKVYAEVEKAEQLLTRGLTKREIDVFVKVLRHISRNVSEDEAHGTQ